MLTALIFSAVILFTGCGGSSYTPVSDIAEKWHEVKTIVSRNSAADGNSAQYAAELSGHIDRFYYICNEFFASPLYAMYVLRHTDDLYSLEKLDSEISRFKAAVISGDINDIFNSILEIDNEIQILQRIDENLSAKSQLHYFQLFFFFSMLVIVIILGMRFLYSRLEKAEDREKQTHIFSREVIMAQENERKRIARDLHDTVLQDMWRLSFQIKDEEAAKEQREIMRRIRGICDTLIPPDFQRRGLVNALESLCYNFWQRTKLSGREIECHIKAENDISLILPKDDTQLQCYRIVQECLSNIEKHAEADNVFVLLRKSPDGLLLISVSDNGKGFAFPDNSAIHSLRAEGHFGIWDIYERAAYINAELDIKSGIGEGSLITLKVPPVGKKERL